VGTKAQRRAARERVDAYHEARLGELVEHIAVGIDRYRTGEIDAYTLDETIHHYHRAARELWKFCWSDGGGTHLEIIAHVLDRMVTDGDTIDWWSTTGAAPWRMLGSIIPKPSRTARSDTTQIDPPPRRLARYRYGARRA